MKIPDGSGVDVGWMLKCQLAVTAHDEAGRLRDATSVQSHGALDDAYGGYCVFAEVADESSFAVVDKIAAAVKGGSNTKAYHVG